MSKEINESNLHSAQKALYDALIMRLGLMVKENVELEQRVHQLVEDYNRVAKQLRGEEKHEPNTKNYTLGELTEALDKCKALEKDNTALAAEYRDLEKQCIQLQKELDEAKTHVGECESQKNELLEHIHRFDKSEFVECGVACTHRGFTSDDNPVMVGSGRCVSCRHFIKADVYGKKCVFCAVRYDNTMNLEAQENKNTDE